MKKIEMEEIFLEIIEIISCKNGTVEEEFVEKMIEFEHNLIEYDYSIECDYLIGLWEILKDELCIEEYCNVEYCKEIIIEIANSLELHSVIEKLEDAIMPEENMVYCPECENVLHLTDEFFVCECGWTTNY